MNFQQSDLLSDDVMLLDNKRTIYVWIGEYVKNEEKKHAYDIAVEYLKTGNQLSGDYLLTSPRYYNIRLIN